MVNTASREERLRDLVRLHQICYEVWPEYWPDRRGKVQVGFDLQLYGTHERKDEHPSPGCPACERVFEDLRQIAEWILPKDLRPSHYEILPFDRSLHFAPVRHFRREVVLTIKILHRQDGQLPVDECERTCLHEMTKRLKQLGATEAH